MLVEGPLLLSIKHQFESRSVIRRLSLEGVAWHRQKVNDITRKIVNKMKRFQFKVFFLKHQCVGAVMSGFEVDGHLSLFDCAGHGKVLAILRYVESAALFMHGVFCELVGLVEGNPYLI